MIPNPEPLVFQVKGVGSDVTSGSSIFAKIDLIIYFLCSGTQFHSLLDSSFRFETETETSKSAELQKVAVLPSCLPGKTKTQVKIVKFP